MKICVKIAKTVNCYTSLLKGEIRRNQFHLKSWRNKSLNEMDEDARYVDLKMI